MNSLYDYNRTLISDFEDFLNSKNKSRNQSFPLSQEMKMFTNLLLSNSTLLNPYVKKLVESGGKESYLDSLLSDIENDARICK